MTDGDHMAGNSLRTEVEIRPAAPQDAAAIFAVHGDSVECLCRDFYSPRQIAMWLEGRSPASYQAAISNGHMLVATLAHEVVGFVEAVPGEIVKLFVSGSVAGQGVGDRLMRVGLAKALERNNGAVRIESTRNAEAFYLRYGFERVGEGVFSRGGSSVSIEIVQLVRQAA